MLPKACLQTRHPKAAQCDLCNRHGVTVYHSHRRVVASHLVFEGSLAGEYTLAYTLLNISERNAPSKGSYWKFCLAGIFVVLALSFLRWGGYLLVARNRLPEHVDVAVVLQGSVAGERPRIATAMTMLQRGSTERVVQ